MQCLLGLRLLGLTKCPIECLRTACRSYFFLLRQSLTLLSYLQHSQRSEKLPKLQLFPNKANTNNNRPISLLPALSRVCKRVAYNQFVTYLTTSEGLTTKLRGNKKWFSTETSLIDTTDAFLKRIVGVGNKLTAYVLLDMSKAFDSVDLQILFRIKKELSAPRTAC